MDATQSTGGGDGMRQYISRHPAASYTLLAYAISWIGCILQCGPKFLRGEVMTMSDLGAMGLMMFAGPSIASLSLTYLIDGREGLGALLSRMGRWRVNVKWYGIAILLPPALILLVLFSLAGLVSPAYAPGCFVFGIVLGLMTAFFEEIGWIGFLYPKLREGRSVLSATLGVGLIHGVWHLTATYLGSAQWLGIYFIPYFASMWIIAMTAMRVLQVWVHINAKESILLVQLMHGSSTGFLLVLTPVLRLPATETLWFSVYAIVLWIVALIVIKKTKGSLGATKKVIIEYSPRSSIQEYTEYTTI
jgi:membrane protease YdiL (CAAX protease family)